MTQLEGVHDRIGHPRYRMISLILQDALYGALTRKDSPAHALRNAQKRIEALE
jgi:hypothetical protein